LGSRRQAPDGWEAVTRWLKTEASVSYPTEALFFAAPKAFGAAPPPKFSQACAAQSPAAATVTAAARSAKFAQNGGIADLRHDPGFRHGLHAPCMCVRWVVGQT
jgi:hypothetical protein